MEKVLTLYTPHEKQLAVHRSRARFKVLAWGRQAGKSSFAINECLLKALETPGRYWIVLPTYRQAKNIYWYDLAINLIPKELIQRKNESELIIYLKNGATIELKGADNPDTLRGTSLKGIIIDEAAFISPTAWEVILEPQLTISKGWVIFISTPNGFNWFYDLKNAASRTEGWLYSHATSYDNPYQDPAELERIRAKTPEDRFHQEYLAEFRKMEGLVYKEFDRDIHLVNDIIALPEHGTDVLSIDFGYTNPLAALFLRIDYDNNWWAHDLVYETQLDTGKAIDIIRTKMSNRRFSYIIGDPAQAQEIANFNAKGFPVQPAQKGTGSIQAGIREVAGRLKVKGNGKPSFYMLNTPAMEPMLREFEMYRYPNPAENRNPNENPVDEFNHALDALRYIGQTINSDIAQDFAFPEENLFDGGSYR